MDDNKVVEEQIEEVEQIEEIKKNSSSKKKSDKTDELEEKIKELDDQLKRAVADYRNLEKRFDEERRSIIKFANRDLLLRLIPSFDTLFLAEKYIKDDGIKLTVKSLKDALKDAGVENISVDGEAFNPEVMEAIAVVEGEDGMVLEELRPGYMLNGKLIRPAQVKVGKKE